jgi:TonB-linked SusC/RagA family outer membrane protein
MSAKSQTYDFNYNDKTIEQVIKDLRHRTGYQFFYKKETVQKASPFTCKYRNLTLTQFLDREFYEERGISYEISKGTVILKKAPANRPYFKRNISGLVTDENDEPLIGVTVMVKGTQTGTVTDVEGQFSLLVEGTHPKLEFTYVGMKPKTVSIEGRQHGVLQVKMQADEHLLSEVLVTGYQDLKRENATGAYQQISSKELSKRYTSDLASRLEGQVPGLTLYSNGNNGSGENAMTIRGVGSFNAKTSPLIVVDGLPIEGSLETVNAYDIENINVLKDASAAAIYGARASNGVIVITTKRGKKDRLEVDFNADLTISDKQSYSNYGWADADQTLQIEEANFNYVKSREDLISSLVSTLTTNPHALSPASRLMVRHYLGQVSDEDYAQQMNTWRNNDYRQQWKDTWLRQQIQHQYNLSLRSHGKVVSSSLVFNFKGDNMGTVKEHDNTLSMSYAGDVKAARWLDLSFGIHLMNERAKTHYSDSYNGINSFQPYLSLYNDDGTPAEMEAAVYLEEPTLSQTDLGLKSESYNLLDEVNQNFTRARRNNIRTYAHATVKLLPELNVQARFQYEDIIYKGETRWESDSYYMRHLYNLFTSSGTHYLPEGGMLKTNHSNGDYYTFRIQANFAKTFAEKHDVEAIAGFEYRDTHTRETNNLYVGYDDETQTNMNYITDFNDLTNLTSSDLGVNYSPTGYAPTASDFQTSDITHRFYSYYFTVNYTYDSRYAVQGSYRVDKADLFGADPKFRGRPLWSVGASWNLQNEAFMKSQQWIDLLKLRASYGLTGNIDQNVSSYLTAAIAVNEVNSKKMATLNTPPNDQLRWEKTASWNFGVDFSFFNHRLSGALDFYRKTSSDLLALTDIDPTSGWSSLTINNGKARNQGVELQLNGVMIQSNDDDHLGLSGAFNIAYNSNKVLRIDHTPTSGYEALTTLHEGHPINSLYSYRFAGMQTSEDGTQSYGWYKADGTVHTSDISTGEFEVEDVVYSGGLDPKVTIGFTPTITWKGFSLSALMMFYGGHYMRVGMDRWTHEGYYTGYSQMVELDAVPAAYLDYWNATDKTTAIANGYPGSTTIGDYSYIDQTVQHADYFKLRNIVLGYTFPQLLCKRLGVAGLRIQLQMNNVATWARNKYSVDPEANNPVTGFAINKTPKSYTMSLSINL